MSDMFPENRPSNTPQAGKAATVVRGMALHESDDDKKKFLELLALVLEGEERRVGVARGKRYEIHRSENGVTVSAFSQQESVLYWATEVSRRAKVSIITPYSRYAKELMVRFP